MWKRNQGRFPVLYLLWTKSKPVWITIRKHRNYAEKLADLEKEQAELEKKKQETLQEEQDLKSEAG